MIPIASIITSQRSAGLAIALAVFVGTACPAAIGQDADSLNVDLGECVHLQSPQERFACYENRVNTALERRTPDDATAVESVSSPTVNEAAAETAVAIVEPATREPAREIEANDSAESASTSRTRLRDRNTNDNELPPEILGTVVALREILPDSYLITLENGEVWRQTRPRRYRLRVGHEVRLYPTVWGSSYRLTVEELNGFIQVRRVR